MSKECREALHGNFEYVNADGITFVMHSAYHGDGRPRFETDVGDLPSLTRQEFADECDINGIMAKYEKTGMLPVNGAQPSYVDFTAVPSDLQEAMRVMMDAETAFMSLPANVRKEFDNDALRFVEFAQDGDNLEQLREWGLAEPEKAPDAPMRVEVVNPPEVPPAKPVSSSKPPEGV